ncbi:hypothetical protein GCM10023196_067780 [Actinoallomurus vinaceus]|uniref:Uncharacterized protein n=1 Tax=Actinoallomurus vinaceus TaxID=1080074 RepID=A0ABP8UJQ5_9ACTN
MGGPQLHENGRTATQRTGDSGKSPKRTQYAGIVGTMHKRRDHRRDGHAARADHHAPYTVACGGGETVDHPRRRGRRTRGDPSPPCDVQSRPSNPVPLYALWTLYRSKAGNGQVAEPSELRT